MDIATTDRNVYILGAGFSVAAGAPLIHDFLDRARDVSNDPILGLDPHERIHFERLFEFRRKMSQAREKVRIDLDNIEHLFGLVEVAHRFQGPPSQTRESTVYAIAKTLERTISNTPYRGRVGITSDKSVDVLDRLRQHDIATVNDAIMPRQYMFDPYVFFALLVAGGLDNPQRRAHRCDAVISFNYDLVLDDAIRRIGTAPRYELPTSLLEFPSGAVGPRLLKLHGSANWGICGCRNRIIVLGEKITAESSGFRERLCDVCGLQQFQPLLVPPSWDKSEYREIMRPIWQAAIEELSLATRICIIGYSIPETDTFFSYLMTAGLAENHQLERLIVVDLGDAVQKKYDRWLEPTFHARRFRYYGDSFIRWLGNNPSLIELNRGETVTALSTSLY